MSWENALLLKLSNDVEKGVKVMSNDVEKGVKVR